MQLSNRLKTLADMVTKGSTVADVGCDHAYVSIYLMDHKIAKEVIAMDINKGPLQKAIENIESHHLSDHIKTKLSDGLMELSPGDVNTILIAGMGGALTVKILSAREDIIKQVREIIISPHSEIFLVREYLRTHGFAIVKEQMVKEGGKYYTIIKALRGKEEDSRSEDPDPLRQSLFDRYGKYLLEEKNPVLNEYLHVELTKRMNVRKHLLRKTQECQQRILELENDIKILEGGLSYYDL